MQVNSVVIGHAVRFVQSVGLAGGVAALALVGSLSQAYEYVEFPDRNDMAQLEAAFWECERTSATTGMDIDSGVLCAEITERLRQERFGGSFDEFLQFWNQGKAVGLTAPAPASSEDNAAAEMAP
jgi:hypothetical protein